MIIPCETGQAELVLRTESMLGLVIVRTRVPSGWLYVTESPRGLATTFVRDSGPGSSEAKPREDGCR